MSLTSDSNHSCDVCPLAKQSRLSFGTSSITSVKPFDLIHCDIWGPYKHPSLSGAHYFLTIVDDYSLFTWVFLMRYKDETQLLVKQFFAFASTQFSSRIKSFRSDNGAEFLSLQNFFKDNGVIFQHSCVYTPQQNGVVERKHRHILQVARAFKFQANLPPKFWGECVLTVVHVINHFPTPLLSFKTPFEHLYSKPPPFHHLHVFGCLAYATNVNVKHKFDPRASKCIFIGYLVGQKAYKLYDLSSDKIFSSRDVIFHGTIFPFSDALEPNPLAQATSPIPLPIHHDDTSPDSFPEYTTQTQPLSTHIPAPITDQPHTSTERSTCDTTNNSAPSLAQIHALFPASTPDPTRDSPHPESSSLPANLESPSLP